MKFNVRGKRWALAVVVILCWTWGCVGAQQSVAIDPDDIGGVVRSAEGPEAGVWVVAETDDLPTKFIRIVVTDDQGRYVLPDLPQATYQVWVRGYGLVDSTPVNGRVGQTLNLTAVLAPTPRDAAEVYPASYWFALAEVPEGPIAQTELTTQVKFCIACHPLGSKITREIPTHLGTVSSHLEAWDERVLAGVAAPIMGRSWENLGPQRTMLSDWSERIAAGEFPQEGPTRPSDVERNIVVTMWDWANATAYAHDEIASDKRDYQFNANGLIWGPNQFGDTESADTLNWLDPVKHETGMIKIPTTIPRSEPEQSPYFAEPIWSAAVQPRCAGFDEFGRVYVAGVYRTAAEQPNFCKTGSTNKFAQWYPLDSGSKQVPVWDPETEQFTVVDTCFRTDHNDLGEDDNIYWGFTGGVGWIDTQALDQALERTSPGQPLNQEAVQGWCQGVLDTNGDGQITQGWTEPDQPIDPTKDHRINFRCYQPSVAPDGAVWCGSGSERANEIVRVEIGRNPPQSCRAERYELPTDQDVAGARGLEVDSEGVVWANLSATDHFASFDRRKCRGPLNGPNATGQHCQEGWEFHPIPTLKFQNLPTRGPELMYLTHVDRFDVLGLNNGNDIVMSSLNNSSALLAFRPESRTFVTMRVPYPLGFLARSVHGRIDDLSAGWKGRGLWAAFGAYAPWHVEGGPGTRPKVAKFQLRPNPLAK